MRNLRALSPFLVAIILIAGLTAWLEHDQKELMNSVKSGESTLRCFFDRGWVTVSPDKILGVHEDQWVFVNGAASTCELEKTL